MSNKFIRGIITEYDIEQCDISVMKFLNIISEERYNELKNKDKLDRVKTIGLMKRNDSELHGKIKNHVDVVMDNLIKSNSLDDEAIIERVFDAIWIKNNILTEGLNYLGVTFRDKRQYNSLAIIDGVYYYLNCFTGETLVRYNKDTHTLLKPLIFDVMGLKERNGATKDIYLKIHHFRCENKEDKQLINLTNQVLDLFLM